MSCDSIVVGKVLERRMRRDDMREYTQVLVCDLDKGLGVTMEASLELLWSNKKKKKKI